MNFQPSEDQAIITEAFSRFLEEHSSMSRVRAAMPSGFDPELWRGFARMGGFGTRVPDNLGGSGLGLFDAVLLMEVAGRTLASGPLAEGIVAARILAACGEEGRNLLGRLLTGDAVVTLALQDASTAPSQWLAGGAVADSVIALDGNELYIVSPNAEERKILPNLASTPMALVRLDRADRTLLANGAEAVEHGRRTDERPA